MPIATGHWRNPNTKKRIDTASHAQVDVADLEQQGYSPLLSRAEKGGELFYQDIGGGQQWQEFVQRPAGWTPTGQAELPSIDETAGIASGADIQDIEQAGGLTMDNFGLEDKDGDGIPDMLTSDEATADTTALTEGIADLELENEEDKKLLEEEAAQIESDIDRMYDRYETELKERFVGERGTERVAAFRLGQAGTPYEVAQEKEYEDRRMRILRDLQREKDSKISQAKLALKQGKRDLARDLTADIENLRDKQRQIQQDDWNRKLQKFNAYMAWGREQRAIAGEERTEAEYQAEQAIENITQMAGSGVDMASISDEEKADFEQKTGMAKGTFEAIYTGIQDAQIAEAEGDAIKRTKSIVDLLAKVPENMEIPIGDKIYQGLKEVDADLMSYTETIGNENWKVMVEKETGEEVWRKSMGAKYKTGTGARAGAGEPMSEWDYAQSIFDANPNASDEELKAGLLKNTDLNVTEINSLIAERGVKQEQADRFLTSAFFIENFQETFELEAKEEYGWFDKSKKAAYVADRMKEILDEVKRLRNEGLSDTKIKEMLFEEVK